MTIGALVRTEERGLGIQSRAFMRHLAARPLVIDIPNRSAHVCPPDFGRIPGATVARVRSGWRLDERVVRPWLDGLDALWTAETFYDDRLPEWCRAAGVRTAIHANPEFLTPNLRDYGLGRPDLWWSATSWRLPLMPAGTEVRPWPTELVEPVERHDAPCRFLFIGGRDAIGDRNGAVALIAALGRLRHPCSVRIVSQEPSLPAGIRAPEHVRCEVILGGMDSPEALYQDCDVLVMPRRYGGLCLPVIEAMARGMAVVMTDLSPNPQTWPILGVPTMPGERIRVPCGDLRIADIDPVDLAVAMDSLHDPERRGAWQDRARAWAEANTWDVVAPQWREALEPTSVVTR